MRYLHALTFVVLLAPAAAGAQDMGRGFFFKEPTATWSVRVGYGLANAESEIFSFTSRQLTVDKSDFSGVNVGSDLDFRLTSRLALGLGLWYEGRSAPSEYRDFVDQDDLPIEQTTKFQRMPITLGLKYYVMPRGRSIGQFAWIPAKVAPYVGAGGGAMWYSFKQNGDFIDQPTLDVFHDTFKSSGWTPEAHAMAGVDISLTPRLVLTGEGRYTYAKANMEEDFVGFDKIDLSGFAITAGLALRF
jgi:opacity protein-like surface antigen